MSSDDADQASVDGLRGELEKLRRDLEWTQRERSSLETRLSEARVREATLHSAAQDGASEAGRMAAEAAMLRRQLELEWQQKTSAEVRLAAARVRITGLEGPAPGGAAIAEGDAWPATADLARLDLATLRCVSLVDDPAARGAGWTMDHVRIGRATVPILRIRDALYLPTRGLTIVGEGIVPLELVSYASNLAFVTGGDRGGTVDARPVHVVDAEVCILGNLFSMTFGHWLDEELPKVFLLEQHGFRGRYVVCPTGPDGRLPRFIHESLRLLGVPQDRIVDSLPGVTRFGTVVLTPVIVQEQALAHRDVYLGFREHLLTLAGATSGAGERRLWMTRGAGTENGRRELVNGDEIMDLLVQHRFEMIDLGALPFAQQLATVRTAAVLAGAHGSGMKHVLFQPPASTVIECFTPHHLNTSVLNHCRLLRHRYHMVVQDTAYTDYRWGLELRVPADHLALILETLPRSVRGPRFRYRRPW